MKKMVRPECPEWLATNQKKWTDAYCNRRQQETGASFSWPQYENKKINHLLQEVLNTCTTGHCSYCDGGFPLGCASRDTIDHFKPKEAFCSEAFAWNNLYIACDCCQQVKLNRYSENLLRPDDTEFSFLKYFQFNYRTGHIEPNPLVSPETQAKAQETIKILGLNEHERPNARLSELKVFQNLQPNAQADLLETFNYRFILEIELDYKIT